MKMASAHWRNKNVVVCGASSGLGLELAEQLTGQGARVLMVARNAQRLASALHTIREKYSACDVAALPADLSQPRCADQLAAFVRDALLAPVDLLINAIGTSDRGTIMSLSPERLGELLETNVQTAVLASQRLHVMLRQPGAVIVNIGSLASRFAPRYLGGYSASKHALAAVSQQMRLELAPEGIQVMLVCPGPIRRGGENSRYDNLPGAVELPPKALGAGGGANLRGLDVSRLATHILQAAAARQPELIRPRKARLLMILTAISPRLGDYLLRRMTT